MAQSTVYQGKNESSLAKTIYDNQPMPEKKEKFPVYAFPRRNEKINLDWDGSNVVFV